jgi:hypothetical protein
LDTTDEKATSKPLRSLLEQLELAVKLGSHEELESAANELLATVKCDLFHLVWRQASPPDQTVEYYSEYLEKIEMKMREIPEKPFSVRLYRECGHCGHEKQLITTAGYLGDNVRKALDMFEFVEDL